MVSEEALTLAGFYAPAWSQCSGGGLACGRKVYSLVTATQPDPSRFSAATSQTACRRLADCPDVQLHESDDLTDLFPAAPEDPFLQFAGRLLGEGEGDDARRVAFRFTPANASWLNHVEGFLSILTRRSLRRWSFPSRAALRHHIEALLADLSDDEDPTPFV